MQCAVLCCCVAVCCVHVAVWDFPGVRRLLVCQSVWLSVCLVGQIDAALSQRATGNGQRATQANNRSRSWNAAGQVQFLGPAPVCNARFITPHADIYQSSAFPQGQDARVVVPFFSHWWSREVTTLKGVCPMGVNKACVFGGHWGFERARGPRNGPACPVLPPSDQTPNLTSRRHNKEITPRPDTA